MALIKTKTFWAGLAAIIGGVGTGVVTGNWIEGATAIWAGITTICMRDAVAKKQ